jgi:hypothetical protein
MRIVVTQLTRMRARRICVAGIEPDTGRHIRPTTGREHPLTRDLLALEGGPFAIGALLDLGDVTPNPAPPETEDHLFTPEGARVLGHLSSAGYLELLQDHANRRLQTIFGGELTRRGRSYTIDCGRGVASLGILRPRRRPDLHADGYGKLRVRLRGEGRPLSLPVTDVRLVEPDHKTIRAEVVEDLNARMRRGVDVLLMLGLARPFRAAGDDRERHWLQVNGICMEDRPLGDEP